jgi:hypothetical protein
MLLAAMFFNLCPRDVDNELGDQRPQLLYRRDLHKQCDKALHLKMADVESDAQKQYKGRNRLFNLEEGFPVSAYDNWHGHWDRPLKQVGDCSNPVVQDDVATSAIASS